jgi:hypothetical protein
VLKGKSLQQLVVEVERQYKSKRDFIADAGKLSFFANPNDGVVLNGVNGGMPLRPTAHAQMSQTLAIPKSY